tara:strand:+ start:688 stop:1080 length:393 start_codon:yes stop_codon:yes gene_type:complete
MRNTWTEKRDQAVQQGEEEDQIMDTRRKHRKKVLTKWAIAKQRTIVRRADALVIAYAKLYAIRPVPPSIMEIADEIKRSYGTAYNCLLAAQELGLLSGVGDGVRAFHLTEEGWKRAVELDVLSQIKKEES